MKVLEKKWSFFTSLTDYKVLHVCLVNMNDYKQRIYNHREMIMTMMMMMMIIIIIMIIIISVGKH